MESKSGEGKRAVISVTIVRGSLIPALFGGIKGSKGSAMPRSTILYALMAYVGNFLDPSAGCLVVKEL